jgi:hypothetical protein
MKRLRFLTSTVVCRLALLTYPSLVKGFHKAIPTSIRVGRYTQQILQCSNEANDYDLDAAAEILVWERIQSSASRPVLDLSSKDASPEEADTNTHGEDVKNRENWSKGQYWKQTSDGLQQLGITGEFLPKCPQLLRLYPGMVLATAEWLRNEFGVEYLRLEPRLLSYPLTDVKYGLEFMSTMMMTDAKPACRASPDLFRSAIEGGIQEQSVKAALGAAGDATSKATQTIAGDAMASLKNLKNRKGLS